MNEQMNCISCQNCVTCQNKYSGTIQTPQTPQTCNPNQPLQQPQQPQNKQSTVFPPKMTELTLWATAKCNLRCDYCFIYKQYESQPDKDLSSEVIEALPGFMAKYFVDKPMLWFFGGEPLLNMEGIQAVTEKLPYARYGVTSNLTLLDEAKANWLRQHHFSILCSVDGAEATHDLHRKYPNGKGSWSQAYKGLLNARLVQPNATIRCTYTPETVSALYESFKTFLKYGFTHVALEPVYETDWNAESLMVLQQQIIEVAQLTYELSKSGHHLQVKPLTDIKRLLWQGRAEHTKRCGLAKGNISMDIDGTLYPCHRYVSSHHANLQLGNVFTGIDEQKRMHYYNQATRFVPRNEDTPDYCGDCLWRKACMGGCYASNYSVTGTYHLMPRSYCQIHNALVSALLPRFLNLFWQ